MPDLTDPNSLSVANLCSAEETDSSRRLHLGLSRRIDLAVGVAQPGSYAKVYGSDNGTLGFQDIHTAVVMADAGLEGVTAYTVLADADVGPCIDIDLPRGLDHVTQTVLKEAAARGCQAALAGNELWSALQAFGPSIDVQRWMIKQLQGLYDRVSREQGAEAAVLPSGRGAHLLPVGLGLEARQRLLDHVVQLQRELRDRLAAGGLPESEAAFEIKSYCRPPASPHRFEGDLGILFYPLPGLDEDPQRQLLDLLAERGHHRIDQGLIAPPFPERLNELRHEGRLVGRRRDLFIRVAVRAGLGFEHAVQLIDREVSAPYESIPRSAEPASRWRHRLEILWRRAQTAVELTNQALAPIRAATEVYDWNYRTGMTDKRVVHAYIMIAEEEASLIVAPGDRRVAEEADCSSATVSRANKRLRDRGWLRLWRRAKHRSREATMWRLQPPRQSFSRGPSHLISSKGGRDASVVSREHDVWPKLPAYAREVYERLTKIPTTAAGTAQAFGLGPRRVQRLFQALKKGGLAVQHGGGRGRQPVLWTKGLATMDQAAVNLGVAGRRARRKRRRALNAAERERYQEAMRGPQPCMPFPS